MKTNANILLLLFALCLFGCSENELSTDYQNKDEITVEHTDRINPNSIKVNQSDAEKVAKLFMQKQNTENSKTRSTTNNQQVIKNVTTIPDSLGNPLLYIINFDPMGFSIISSTKKTNPVLAFSETGYFEYNKDMNEGLTMWLQETLGYVESATNEKSSLTRGAWIEFEDYSKSNAATLRSSSSMSEAYSKKKDEIRAIGNEGISLSSALGILPNDLAKQFQRLAAGMNSPEHYSIVEIIDRSRITTIGPLINTKWNQYIPFGNKTPNGISGCTATAAGQIMYFFKHPKRYNWDKMDGYSITSNNEILENMTAYPDIIASLMRDIGISFKMNYKSDASSATISNVKNGLEKDFGYSCTLKDFDYLDVKSYITQNRRPVYLSGARSTVMIFFHPNGHDWVCEGLKSYAPAKYYKLHLIRGAGNSYSYTTDGYENVDTNTSFYTTLNFYMNWGWGGRSNGWYGFNDSRPNDRDDDYKHRRKALYIQPK